MDAAGLLASTAAMRWIGVTKRNNAEKVIDAAENRIIQNHIESQRKMYSVKLLPGNYLEISSSTQLTESLLIHSHPPLFSSLELIDHQPPAVTDRSWH